MAHDVGTPLTAVSAHLQLVTVQVSDAALRERLRSVQAQVDRAVAAARRFLDAARPPARRIPVDLSALLKNLSVLVGPEAERKSVIIVQEAQEPLPRVAADAGQMQQLLLNLMTNALDAMAGGGQIRLTAEAAHKIVPGVRISVVDTGPGMTPEVHAHAFDAFFTTRAATGGTGLGLAICHRIVSDHAGLLWLETFPGQGTRAIFELPAEPE